MRWKILMMKMIKRKTQCLVFSTGSYDAELSGYAVISVSMKDSPISQANAGCLLSGILPVVSFMLKIKNFKITMPCETRPLSCLKRGLHRTNSALGESLYGWQCHSCSTWACTRECVTACCHILSAFWLHDSKDLLARSQIAFWDCAMHKIADYHDMCTLACCMGHTAAFLSGCCWRYCISKLPLHAKESLCRGFRQGHNNLNRRF